MRSKRLRASVEARSAFATRLRSLMEERGLTIAEIAERTKEHLPAGEAVSRASLRHYLSGRSVPRPHCLDALARVLGVASDALAPDLVETAPEQVREAAPSGAKTSVSLEDLGDQVHLQIHERVTWDVALKVMTLLKTPEAG